MNEDENRNLDLERQIDELFFDPKEAKIWKKEGIRHMYLYWIRATVTREREEPPFEAEAAVAAATEDRLRLATGRWKIYSLLTQGFTEPTDCLAGAVAAGSYRRELEQELEGWRPAALIDEGLADLAEAEKAPADELHDQMLTAYTRLFYDSFLPFVAPYESVYHGERQVIGERSDSVRDAYAQMGLGIDGVEPPDHIMNECEFLAHLAERETVALESGDLDEADGARERSRRFLEDHLLTWGTKLTTDICALARSPFYLGLAKTAQGFWNVEKQILDTGY